MKIIVVLETAQVAKIDWNESSFEVTQQPAIFESDDGAVRGPIVLNLPKGSAPYKAGEYRLGDESFFYDGKYKRIEMRREVSLVSIAAVKAVSAVR